MRECEAQPALRRGITGELLEKQGAATVKKLAVELAAALMPGRRAIPTSKKKLTYVMKDGSRRIDVQFDAEPLLDASPSGKPMIYVIVRRQNDDREWGEQAGARIHQLHKVERVVREHYQLRGDKVQRIEEVYEILS